MRYELREGQDDRRELYRIEEDETETLLGTDRGEPEDNSFLRDLAWVPEELNRLGARIAELEQEDAIFKTLRERELSRHEAFITHMELVIPAMEAAIETAQEHAAKFYRVAQHLAIMHRRENRVMHGAEEEIERLRRSAGSWLAERSGAVEDAGEETP